MSDQAYNKMVGEFQCPGCVNGSDITCGSFKLHNDYHSCSGHVAGTHVFPGGTILLGMPKGFDKLGENPVKIRFVKEGENPQFNHLNIPVWAMEKEGFLFVREYSPRISRCYVVVIEGGTIEKINNEWSDGRYQFDVINVAEFIDEID